MAGRCSHTIGLFLPMLTLLGGCFAEGSFPLREEKLHIMTQWCAQNERHPLPAREWGSVVQRQMEYLLPPRSRGGLASGELRQSDGRPIDAGRTFGLDLAHVDRLLDNLHGLAMTAQVIPVKEPRQSQACWPGCHRVAIPMSDGLKISALLADPGGDRAIDGSYIVLLHGLFGRQYGNDQRNTVAALRAFGHHVLAVEMRGHGTTETENPQAPMTFGIDEPRDLLEIDHWLRERQGAKHVGLVGFSLTAHQSLLAAWIDSNRGARMSVSGSPLFESLPAPGEQPAFDAGMVLFSPVVNLVPYCNSLDTPRGMLISPVRAAFQDRAAIRLAERGQKPQRRMWAYVGYELQRSKWMKDYGGNYPPLLRDTISLIDFTGSWKACGSR
jgi:pimeloyl-ACP methyl ester carboxylesterase